MCFVFSFSYSVRSEQQNVTAERYKCALLFCVRFMSPVGSVAALTKQKQQRRTIPLRLRQKAAECRQPLFLFISLIHFFKKKKKSTGLAGFPTDAAIMAVKEPLRNKENCLVRNEEKNMNSKMFLKWFSV